MFCSDRCSISVLALCLVTTSCATYRVDTVLDAPDANPGDRRCARAVPPVRSPDLLAACARFGLR